MEERTAYETLNELADVWDKLTKRQKTSIAKMIASANEKEYIDPNQITLDEFIAGLESPLKELPRSAK